ncbi:ribbon-helix-helix protein, CopG family [Nanohaloarchaea archaeon]|jgi:metal-responsive CopG/Arc/MetJ family transcriptional regulator|nr:ribbon-helix-helix protein, CopG family [Candidatus Nanohaloarchaea archaeon]
MQRFTFSIPQKLKKELEDEADTSGRSEAEIIRSSIWHEVKQ